MKKLSLALVVSILTVSAVHAISINEYVQKNGPIIVTDGAVKLNNQDLTSLDGIEFITQPDKVTSLDLSNNKLTVVTAEQLSIFPNLERLNLSNNQLTALPRLNLSKLKKIKVKKNKLEALSNLNLPALKKLKAGNNPIHTLSNLDLPKLKKLKMQGNKLTNISNINIPKIKKIKVGGPASELFIEMGITAKKIK